MTIVGARKRMTALPKTTSPTPPHPHDGGALVVRLRADEDTIRALQRKEGRISAFMGSAVHQAFHAAISDEAAAALHDPSLRCQPFAASTLFRWQLDIPFQGQVQVGERAWVRFVGLHPYILRELDAFRRHNPRTLEVDRTPWHITSCHWHGHQYAGRFSAAQRFQQHRQLAPPHLLKLRFVTPTFFKSRGQHVHDPAPRLVFAEGLLLRWTELYPSLAVPHHFERFVEEHVHIRRYLGCRTTTVMVKRAVFKGLTGDVLYAIDLPPQPDRWHIDCARFVSLLAEYATYAGVGKKTTMGLGMVDRLRLLRYPQAMVA